MKQSPLTHQQEQELAYTEAKSKSDALISKGIHFTDEKNSDGPVTRMGFMRRYTRKTVEAALAFLGSTPNLLSMFVTDDLGRIAKEIAETINTTFINNLMNQQPSLVATFTERVQVNNRVYSALFAEVADLRNEIKLIAQRKVEAESPEFIGPLTAEFEAYRQSQHQGPLKCQFDAYSLLKEKGIEYYPEEDVFVFPSEMVETLRAKFEDASDTSVQINNPEEAEQYYVLVFNQQNAAQHEATQHIIHLPVSFETLRKFFGTQIPTPQ